MLHIVVAEPTVAKKIYELKVNKSPGPDGLHPRVLYEVRSVIVTVITLLFNKSLSSSYIPLDWKKSIVSVLHKKGSKFLVENYRPISLTCILCKLLESIIRDQLMAYFIDNELFSKKQYGFIKGRSTILQLLTLLDDWTKIIDVGGQIDVIYTDFEKAFDRVPHNRLISKLFSYGVNIEVINWIRSFLYDRTFSVRINGKFSSEKRVLSGIPQGSVLGPVLFIIYINDLPEDCGSLSEMFLYADDAKLYKSISGSNDVSALSSSCDSLLNWSERWLMKLNTSKCNVMSVTRKCSNTNCSCDYYFNFKDGWSDKLEHIDCVKDLGVQFKSDLSFNNHIYDKINIAYKMLGLINRNFKDMDTVTFILLYKSLVRSHLEYAGVIWNPYQKTLIRDLERVQKRATKMLYGFRDQSYVNRLKLLKLPTLRYRRLRGDMIEVFKIVNNMYDVTLYSILKVDIGSKTRGNDFKLKKELCNLDVRKYFFSCRVVNVWNSLPNSVVLANSVNSFKNKLDMHWDNACFKYDYEAEISGSYY
jgi:hypothetical protein